MMYSEFVAGTGCKENDHNYKVFCNLEVMYMNTDMSKQEIYEYGKKLVDNSKSEAELKIEAEIKAEIDSLKERVNYCKSEVEYYEENLRYWKAEGDKLMAQHMRGNINYYKNEARIARNRIGALKIILNPNR